MLKKIKGGGIIKESNKGDELLFTIELPKITKEQLELIEKNKEDLELTIVMPKLKTEVEALKIKANNIKINKKNKRNKKIIFTFITLFLVMIGVTVSQITINFKNKKEISNEMIEINKIVEIKELPITNNNVIENKNEKTDFYWKYNNYKMIDVNIDKLKQENNDTIGWISINNSNINSPILQASDNDFYLNHSFNKSHNSAGWIFMDYRNNNIMIENKNSIIYGHALKNNALFGSLNKALEKNWYTNSSNLTIKTVDSNHSYLWEIFSIYKIETTNDYLQTVFKDDDHYYEFLTLLKNRSINNFNIELSSKDKIITLQTCFNGDIKTVIHGKLISFV